MGVKSGARAWLVLAVIWPTLGTGCGGQTEGTGTTVGATACTSNMTWLGGNEGNGEMNPGVACISCHASNAGEGAPTFSVAGTVYQAAHDPDECFGAGSGVQVVITGADGKAQTLATNQSGNFYSTASVALPYQAKVVYMRRENAMAEAQSTGDCNGCHTQNGANLAPGRILRP
jgi:hypothetical protein